MKGFFIMNESKIYAGNLNYSTTAEDLTSLFSQYGHIVEAKLITDRDTGRSKGFSFITFETPEAAQSALAENGSDFMDRKIIVNIAKEQQKRRPY